MKTKTELINYQS